MDSDFGSRSVPVRLTTLDSLCAQTGWTPDIIKIDVEGHSLPVLRGGLDLFRRRKPRIVIELDDPADPERIGALLRPFGYALRVRQNNLFAA